MDANEVEIESVRELKKAVRRADYSVDLDVFVKASTSLLDADRLWEYVSTTGGYGFLKNIELLRSKHEALQFVQEKFGDLRGLVVKADMQLVSLTFQIAQLRKALNAGDRDLPRSYEPLMLDGPTAYFDIDQGSDADTDDHIEEVQAFYTAVSADTDTVDRDEEYWSEAACKDRQQRERRALHDFNLAYLKVKRDVLRTAKDQLEEDWRNLERQYLTQPTALRCGNGELVCMD